MEKTKKIAKKTNKRILFLESSIAFVISILKATNRNPNHIFSILKPLHDSVFEFLTYDSYVSSFTLACELYYSQNRNMKEQLVPFTLWLVVTKANSAEIANSNSWILRAAKFKDALGTIDFNDSSERYTGHSCFLCCYQL